MSFQPIPLLLFDAESIPIYSTLPVRFIASFNEFNVQSSPDMFKEKMQKSKDAFAEIYDSAKPQLDLVIS